MAVFRFASPDMFYLLLVIPVLVVLFIVAGRLRRGRIARFGDAQTVTMLMPESWPQRRRTKFVLLLLAIIFIVTALARPQSGAKLGVREVSGVEMILAVDVSNSMLAEDRLERTKMAIDRLLGELDNDLVGLVVFAGDAYVQLPVTADRNTARQFAQRLSPDMVSRQGTAMGAAIEVATTAFSQETDDDHAKALILISDGENHEDDPHAAAAHAAEQGITIHAIGIGSPEGSPIMIGGDYIRDEEGAPVISRLDEATLRDIALSTGGIYVRATEQELGLEEIVARIHESERTRLAQPLWEEYDEYYQWFLGIALALLLVEFFIATKKRTP